MLDPTTTAIVTGAAANLVAYMLSGQVDTVRTWIGRIFQGGSEEEQAASLLAVEDDTRALAQGVASEGDVRARWSALLATYLAEHPEIQRDIEEIAKSTPTKIGAMNVGEQHNHGSGTFIGRDNYGDITAPGKP